MNLFDLLQNTKKDLRIVFLGCDNAGKTSILKSVAPNKDISDITPTQGFQIKSVQSNGVVLNAILNSYTYGNDRWQMYWHNYFDNNDVVIYVIDSSDNRRFQESADLLDGLLKEEQLDGVPLLVFANKQDLMNSANVAELIGELNLNSIRGRPWHIQPCSAKTKDGLEQGIHWICQHIKRY